MCAITAAAHAVPGGQLAFQPAYSGNDRISAVPLERWDVELPAADNPSGALGGHGWVQLRQGTLFSLLKEALSTR